MIYQSSVELLDKLELFTEGSLNKFAHETNVDIHNRIISYNILSLGKQLKTVGLLVITDAILNRVNDNWRKGKRTHVFIDEIHVIFENEESITFFLRHGDNSEREMHFLLESLKMCHIY